MKIRFRLERLNQKTKLLVQKYGDDILNGHLDSKTREAFYEKNQEFVTEVLKVRDYLIKKALGAFVFVRNRKEIQDSIVGNPDSELYSVFNMIDSIDTYCNDVYDRTDYESAMMDMQHSIIEELEDELYKVIARG